MNECIDCKPVIVEACVTPVCEIMPFDACVKNTLVDFEIGINNNSTMRDVTVALIEEIKRLKLEISKLKKNIK